MGVGVGVGGGVNVGGSVAIIARDDGIGGRKKSAMEDGGRGVGIGPATGASSRIYDLARLPHIRSTMVDRPL